MTLKMRAGVSTADTEYGIALLDEDRDQYWTLNPTAAIVVRTLLAGGTPADATETLAQEYAVDIDSARRDVQELIGELCSAGLLVEDTGRRTRTAPWKRTAR